MAISWGSYVNNDTNNGMRVGYEFTQSPSTVGSGTTSVTVTVKLYVETKAPVSDSTNTFSWSGSFGSGSTAVNISHGTGGGVTLVRTMSRTVSTSYSGTVSSSVSASLNGINAIPGTCSVSGSHSTAKRPFTDPKPVSSVNSVRTGTAIKTSWTRNPTTGQPYDSILVRRSVNGATYTDEATLSGGSTSYNDTGLTPNSSYRYAVRAQNSAGNSAFSYGPTLTIPPNVPAAPSNAQVARSSDTRQVVSWTRGSSTSTAPITQQVVSRKDFPTGVWKNIATLSGTATSFTDSSTQANCQYQYRVQSKNASGTSAWAYTDYVSTTPNPPTNVKAQKQGGDIKLTWTNTTGTRVTAIEVWTTADGVDQSPVFLRIDGQPTSWTHTAPDPSKTWSYRLKTQSGADSNDVAPNLYSVFSVRSNTVQLIAPPNAPSKTSPASGALDATEEHRFTWQHNPIDTTDQTAYQLRWRADGGAWVDSGKVVSGLSSLNFAANTFFNGTQVEWQVRTWGDHADPSPYSTIAVVAMSSRPSATILYPDGSAGTPVVQSSGITAAWDYFDPETTTQSSVRLRIEDANGGTAWTRTLNSSVTSYRIPYTLVDQSTYTLVVSVRDGSGLWSFETEQEFFVSYAKPPAPTITPVWDLDLGGVVVTISHPAPGSGEVEASSADLQSSADGNEWETIATDLDPATTIVDFIPTLDTMNYYRVISYSDIPSSLESQPASVMVRSEGWIFVNGGPDWAYVCRIRDHVETSDTPRREKVLNRFAGRRFPVMTAGESRTRGITVTGRTTGGGSTDREWQDMADIDGPVCYRAPGPAYGGAGDRLFVAFTQYSRNRRQVFEEVSLSFEQVEES